MPLPPELAEHPEDTTVVGNLETLMVYLESGQALRDWDERLAQRLKELEELY